MIGATDMGVFQDCLVIRNDYGGPGDDHNIRGDFFDMQCKPSNVRRRRVV